MWMIPMDEKILSLPLELVNYFMLNEVEGADICPDTEKENLLDEYIGLARQRESAGRNRHPVLDKRLDGNVQPHQYIFHLCRLHTCTPLMPAAFSSR